MGLNITDEIGRIDDNIAEISRWLQRIHEQLYYSTPDSQIAHKAERRRAWVAFATGAILDRYGVLQADQAASIADALLAEYDKRFKEDN